MMSGDVGSVPPRIDVHYIRITPPQQKKTLTAPLSVCMNARKRAAFVARHSEKPARACASEMQERVRAVFCMWKISAREKIENQNVRARRALECANACLW
jgi:hypothetical protein